MMEKHNISWGNYSSLNKCKINGPKMAAIKFGRQLLQILTSPSKTLAPLLWALDLLREVSSEHKRGKRRGLGQLYQSHDLSYKLYHCIIIYYVFNLFLYVYKLYH